MDLSRREILPELMDDPAIERSEHERALRGLSRINRLSRSVQILWPAVCRAAQKIDRPLRVLDLATGAGDLPIALASRARRVGLQLDLQACDISAQGLAYAAERSGRAGTSIKFTRLDVLRDLPTGFDVICISLFLHHLRNDDAARLLHRAARAAGQVLLVNDLRRDRAGYLLAWAGTRLLSRSPVVRVDGPRSVRAAFTLGEARQLAAKAGLDQARIEPRWPRRFLLTWNRD